MLEEIAVERLSDLTIQVGLLDDGAFCYTIERTAFQANEGLPLYAWQVTRRSSQIGWNKPDKPSYLIESNGICTWGDWKDATLWRSLPLALDGWNCYVRQEKEAQP